MRNTITTTTGRPVWRMEAVTVDEHDRSATPQMQAYLRIGVMTPFVEWRVISVRQDGSEAIHLIFQNEVECDAAMDELLRNELARRTVTIHADSTISVDSTITGYCVQQDAAGTAVRAWHNNGCARPRDLGDAIALPQQRYVLSTDDGRAAFERDFLAAWSGGVSQQPQIEE